jgi:hypothetical protein
MGSFHENVGPLENVVTSEKMTILRRTNMFASQIPRTIPHQIKIQAWYGYGGSNYLIKLNFIYI